MNDVIRSYIEAFFEDIPYSQASSDAREKLAEFLSKEYDAIKSCSGNIEHRSVEIHESDKKYKEENLTAFEKIVCKYPTLESVALAAGYTAADINKWRENSSVYNIDVIKKVLKKEKLYAYIFMICVSYALNYIFYIFFDFNIKYMLLAALFTAAAVFTYIRHNKNRKNIEYCSIEAVSYIKLMRDKYTKKALNCIFVIIALAAFLIMFIIESVGSKPSEIAQFVYMNSTIIDIAVILTFKNIIILKFIGKILTDEKTNMLKKHFKYLLIGTSSYWMAAIIADILLPSEFYMNLLLVFLAVAVLAAAVYIFVFRRSTVNKNIVINKKRIIFFSLTALVLLTYQFMQKDFWLTQPYINSIPNIYNAENKIEYDDATGVYTITNTDGGDFKILQLTDIHLGGSLFSLNKDMKALDAVYTLIDYTKPDFVIVTGDLTFPMGIMSFSLNNYAPVMQFASFMRNMGVPWAFTYGNHDTESIAVYSEYDLNALYMSLSYKTSKNLLYPYMQPEITGRSNQMIKLMNADGSLNQAIFLIDSNSYTGEGLNEYDYIHDDQVEWYEQNILKLQNEEGGNVSSMVFFHIPLQQYRTAYELYEAGSDEIEYYFGSNDEKMINKVCASDYPSKLFDTALRLGSTKAFFCGHDHYNNMSLGYKGIRLTYGMSIDYLAMPGIEDDTKQRGATLITVFPDSDFTVEQVPLTSAKAVRQAEKGKTDNK